MSGRANIRTQAITWMVPLVQAPDSTVKTTRYALMPAGTGGQLPGLQFSHGLGIPLARRTRKRPGPSSSGRCARRLLQRMLVEKGLCRDLPPVGHR